MTKIKNQLVALTPIVTLLWFTPLAYAYAQVDKIRSLKWESPLAFDTAEELVITILNAVVTIAIPIIVLMIMYGGFQYVTARGNAEQIKTATRTLTYAIIGGILIIGAVAITSIMENAIGEFRAK